MGVDLAEECRRYEQELQGGSATGPTARRDVEYRAYAVQEGSPLIARRIRELETLAAESRLFVERIRRRDQIVDPDESTTSGSRRHPGNHGPAGAAGGAGGRTEAWRSGGRRPAAPRHPGRSARRRGHQHRGRWSHTCRARQRGLGAGRLSPAHLPGRHASRHVSVDDCPARRRAHPRWTQPADRSGRESHRCPGPGDRCNATWPSWRSASSPAR